MTVLPVTRAVPARTVCAATNLLRARGLRVSAARRLVLEALFAAEGPASAEQIAAGLQGRLRPGDLPSVYRNLKLLEQLGLVRHIHPGHGPSRWALATGARPARGEEEHLFCECCGALLAAPSAQFEAIRRLVRDTFGYEARFSHFPLVGVCPSCSGPRRAREERAA